MRIKESKDQLMRLQAAVTLFVKQQCLRAMQGGQEEWEDLADKNREILDKVLPILEGALDEEHAEQLDELHMPVFPETFMPKMFHVPGFPGFEFPFPKSRPCATKRTCAVGEVIDDFRENLGAEVRKARRHDRSLTEEELNKLLDQLREELATAVKQAPQCRKATAHEGA